MALETCPNCGCSPVPAETRSIGDLSITPDGSVHWYGAPVVMTNSQRLILAALVSAAPHFVTNKALYARIGSTADDPIKPHAVINVHVCNLRKALRRAGAPTCILNEHGRGYRLDAAALTNSALNPPGLRDTAEGSFCPPAPPLGGCYVAADHVAGDAR